MAIAAAVVVATLPGGPRAARPGPPSDPLTDAVIRNIDIEYARQIIQTLSDMGDATALDGSNLGFRSVGSAASSQATDFIEDEMNRIGLVHVVQEAFPADVWEFREAWLDVPDLGRIQAVSFGGSPATGSPITAEIVNVRCGGRNGFAQDIVGKIVLAEFCPGFQWVDTLSDEAKERGAIAVVVYADNFGNSQTPGRIQTHDSVGMNEHSIPLLTISRDHGVAIINQLDQNAPDPIEVTAYSDIRIVPKESGGVAHNAVGYLPGTRYGTPDDEFIILSSHSDAWFFGGMDDNSGVAATLVLAEAIKKATDELGIALDRTLIFTTRDAEEFGIRNTYFDWSYGAWYQITHTHPEWVGRTVANLNFELMGQPPGALEGSASREMFSLVNQVFRDHASTLTYGASAFKPPNVYTDTWTFSAAGIPAINFGSNAPDYFAFYYHTQFETIDLIDFDWLKQEFDVFADLTVRLSKTAVVPYDFQTTAKDLTDILNAKSKFYNAGTLRKIYKTYGVDSATHLNRLVAAASAFEEKADQLDTALSKKGGIDPSDVPEINQQLMSIQAALGQSLVAMGNFDQAWFPYQQNGLDLVQMDKVVDSLSSRRVSASDVTTAMRDIWEWVGFNWFARFLSRTPYDNALSRFSGENQLSWGTQTKTQPLVDLYDEFLALRAIENIKPVPEDDLDPIVDDIRAKIYSQAFPNLDANLEIMWRGVEDANAQIDALLASF
jgi:Iap family predicted aminopeptidase